MYNFSTLKRLNNNRELNTTVQPLYKLWLVTLIYRMTELPRMVTLVVLQV